ncbi:hypothetical protein AB0I22_32405 [Streptomyces sp. NPDC050610]|uniref:hypothetical protein n=1 Tax=Streptomyces sp. NPDC050610 TaxID=3157097 RepID=UPI0034408F78
MQLYAMGASSDEQTLYIDFLDSWSCADVLDVRVVERSEAERIESFVDFAKDFLNEGFSCVIWVDESHLRSWSEPFVHDLLLHGYDDRTREFDVLGFDGDRVFTRLRWGYEEFSEAFARGLRLSAPGGPFEYIHHPMRLMRAKGQSHEFSLPVFRGQVCDFLGGPSADPTRDGRSNWWWTFHPDPEKLPDDFSTVTGVAVYERFLYQLGELHRKGREVDYRLFHLLWEHKAGMVKRLEYVSENLGMGKYLQDVTAGYRMLTSDLFRLRMNVLAEMRRGRADGNIPEHADAVRRVWQREESVAEKLHAVLRVF